MSDMLTPRSGYEVPSTLEKPKASQRSLTDAMLAHLNAASPWLRFVGVLGFVYAGLTVVGGLFSFLLLPLMGGLGDMMGGFWFSDGILGWIGAWWGVFYIAIGVIIFIPSLFTYRFGAKIRSYSAAGADADLEMAFRNNKSLWKFYGILYIASIALTVLVTVGGVVLMAMAVAAEGFF